MERKHRDQIVLAGLLVVLAALGYRAWRTTTVTPRVASNTSTPGRRPAAGAAPLAAPDVHLQALDTEPPAPQAGGRDLFRFGRPPAPAPAAALPAPPPAIPPRSPAAGTPTDGLAPIPLKFIGVVEAADSKARIAVLSDGRGAPLYGQEGATIAGRYQILHIGTESVEMAYLDGRGRQTIRLSGS